MPKQSEARRILETIYYVEAKNVDELIDQSLQELSELVKGLKINTGNLSRDSDYNSVIDDVLNLFKK